MLAAIRGCQLSGGGHFGKVVRVGAGRLQAARAWQIWFWPVPCGKAMMRLSSCDVQLSGNASHCAACGLYTPGSPLMATNCVTGSHLVERPLVAGTATASVHFELRFAASTRQANAGPTPL